MNSTEQSNFFKKIVNASTDEENAARLYKFATESRENFNIMLVTVMRQSIVANNNNVPHQHAVQVPLPVPLPLQVQAHLPLPLPLPLPVQAPLPVPILNNTTQVTRAHMDLLNAIQSSSDRRLAINRLGLNDIDRKTLINKLWRLRNPDAVRQNARRSYQNRRRSNVIIGENNV